jgi:dipeptide/tripeptide permease
MASAHPRGLYRLFFTEMWERLAFYTMLNVLLLYATDLERGGLGLSAAQGNEIYGLYLAFVYFTPFLGGMIADRFLGYRRAVLLGGLTMSTGLMLMSILGTSYFIAGLVCLCVGNGFLKPNISVMVGNLYETGDPKRDSGFNIFYMGINIGAFLASYLSSWVRNDYGWLWTFRVAGLGLLVGMAILVFSWKVLERADRPPTREPGDAGLGTVFAKILLPAFACGAVGYFVTKTHFPGGVVTPSVAGFLAGSLPVLVFFVRLGLTARESERAGLLALLPIYVAGGTFFMILHLNGSAMTQWARDDTDRQLAVIPGKFKQEGLPLYYVNAAEDVPRPAKESLLVTGDTRLARMYGQQRLDESAVRELAKADPELVVREFDAQADAGRFDGADRAIFARTAAVYADGRVKVEEVSDGHGGTRISVSVPDGEKPLRRVAFVRDTGAGPVGAFVVDRTLFDRIYGGYERRFGHPPTYLPPGQWVEVANPELYQSLNAAFVVLFTPLLVGFWAWLAARGRKVSTARKVFYGLCLTTASLLVMAGAGMMSDGGASKVSSMWLVGFYGIVTLGELMLSPMGLSLVTKLTPRRLVGLTMGGWFLATAFGNNFSGFFGGIQGMMSPVGFFLLLAGLAGAAALFVRALLPRLDATLERYGA